MLISVSPSATQGDGRCPAYFAAASMNDSDVNAVVSDATVAVSMLLSPACRNSLDARPRSRRKQKGKEINNLATVKRMKKFFFLKKGDENVQVEEREKRLFSF
jgi:hypothetical protein